jgi:hypothetical protein
MKNSTTFAVVAAAYTVAAILFAVLALSGCASTRGYSNSVGGGHYSGKR